MFVIGMTGPTGAGKTTALREVEKLGGCVLDADAVYHRLLDEDPDLRRELQERFGPLCRPDGTFDRKKLGAVVFHDPAALADLNAIAHRRVVAEMERLLQEAEKQGIRLAAIDAIALFESGADRLCQSTMAITAPPEVRIRRIMAREGIPEEYARARVAAQHPDSFYDSRCGCTLKNNCASPEEFGETVRTCLKALLKESGTETDKRNENPGGKIE